LLHEKANNPIAHFWRFENSSTLYNDSFSRTAVKASIKELGICSNGESTVETRSQME
jgi:hypothetical protein